MLRSRVVLSRGAAAFGRADSRSPSVATRKPTKENDDGNKNNNNNNNNNSTIATTTTTPTPALKSHHVPCDPKKGGLLAAGGEMMMKKVRIASAGVARANFRILLPPHNNNNIHSCSGTLEVSKRFGSTKQGEAKIVEEEEGKDSTRKIAIQGDEKTENEGSSSAFPSAPAPPPARPSRFTSRRQRVQNVDGSTSGIMDMEKEKSARSATSQPSESGTRAPPSSLPSSSSRFTKRRGSGGGGGGATNTTPTSSASMMEQQNNSKTQQEEEDRNVLHGGGEGGDEEYDFSSLALSSFHRYPEGQRGHQHHQYQHPNQNQNQRYRHSARSMNSDRPSYRDYSSSGRKGRGGGRGRGGGGGRGRGRGGAPANRFSGKTQRWGGAGQEEQQKPIHAIKGSSKRFERPSGPRFQTLRDGFTGGKQVRRSHDSRYPQQQQQQQQQQRSHFQPEKSSISKPRLTPRTDALEAGFDTLESNGTTVNVGEGNTLVRADAVEEKPSPPSTTASRSRFTSRRNASKTETISTPSVSVQDSGNEQKEKRKNASRFTKRNSNNNPPATISSSSPVPNAGGHETPTASQEKEGTNASPLAMEETKRTHTTSTTTATTFTSSPSALSSSSPACDSSSVGSPSSPVAHGEDGSSGRWHGFKHKSLQTGTLTDPNPPKDNFVYYLKQHSMYFVGVWSARSSAECFLFPLQPLFTFQAGDYSVRRTRAEAGSGAEDAYGMQLYRSRLEAWSAMPQKASVTATYGVEIPPVPPSPEALANYFGFANFFCRSLRLSALSHKTLKHLRFSLQTFSSLDENGKLVCILNPQHMEELMSAESVIEILEAAIMASVEPRQSPLLSYAIVWLEKTLLRESQSSASCTTNVTAKPPLTPSQLARCTLHLLRLWQASKSGLGKMRVGAWRMARSQRLFPGNAEQSLSQETALTERQSDEALIHNLLTEHLLGRLIDGIEVIARSSADENRDDSYQGVGLGLSKDDVVALSISFAALQKAVTLRMFNTNSEKYSERKIDSRVFWLAIRRFTVSNPTYMYTRDVALSVAQFVTHTHTVPAIVSRVHSRASLSSEPVFVYDSPGAIADSIVKLLELVIPMRVASRVYPVTFFDGLASQPVYQEAFERFTALGRRLRSSNECQDPKDGTNDSEDFDRMVKEYVAYCRERAAQNSRSNLSHSVAASTVAGLTKTISFSVAGNFRLHVDPYKDASHACIAPYRTHQISSAATIYARILTHRKLHASIVASRKERRTTTTRTAEVKEVGSSTFVEGEAVQDYSAVEWMGIVESLLWQHPELNPYASLAFFSELGCSIVLRSTMSDTTTLLTAFARIYSCIIANEKKLKREKKQRQQDDHDGTHQRLPLDSSPSAAEAAAPLSVGAPQIAWGIEVAECFLSVFVDRAIQVLCNFLTRNVNRSHYLLKSLALPDQQREGRDTQEEDGTVGGMNRTRKRALYMSSMAMQTAEKAVGANKKKGESVLSGSEFQLLLEAVQNVSYHPHLALQKLVLHFIQVTCKRDLCMEDIRSRSVQNEKLLFGGNGSGSSGSISGGGGEDASPESVSRMTRSVLLSRSQFASLVRFLFRHPPIPAVDLFTIVQLKLRNSVWTHPVNLRISDPPAHHAALGSNNAPARQRVLGFTTHVESLTDFGATEVFSTFAPVNEIVESVQSPTSLRSTRVTRKAMEEYKRMIATVQLLRMEEYCLTLQSMVSHLHALQAQKSVTQILSQCALRILFDAPYSTSTVSLIQFLASASRVVFDASESRKWIQEMCELKNPPLLLLEAVAVCAQRVLLLLEREGNQVCFTAEEEADGSKRGEKHPLHGAWTQRLLTSPSSELAFSAPFRIPSSGCKLWGNSLETLTHALVMLEHAAPIAKSVNDALHREHGPYNVRDAGEHSLRDTVEMATRCVCFLHRYLKLAFRHTLTVSVESGDEGSRTGAAALVPNYALVDDFELARVMTSIPRSSTQIDGRTAAYLSPWMIPYLCAKERLYGCDRSLAAVFLPYVVDVVSESPSTMIRAAENAADKLITHSRSFSHLVYFLVDVQQQQQQLGRFTLLKSGSNPSELAVSDRLLNEAVSRLRTSGTINDIIRLLTYYGSYGDGSLWQRVLDEAIPTELFTSPLRVENERDEGDDDDDDGSFASSVFLSARDACKRWSYGVQSLQYHKELPLRFRKLTKPQDQQKSHLDEEELEEDSESEHRTLGNQPIGDGGGPTSISGSGVCMGLATGAVIANFPEWLWNCDSAHTPYLLQFFRSLRRSSADQELMQDASDVQRCSDKVFFMMLCCFESNSHAVEMEPTDVSFLLLELVTFISNTNAVSQRLIPSATGTRGTTSSSSSSPSSLEVCMKERSWLTGRFYDLLAFLFVNFPTLFIRHSFFNNIRSIAWSVADSRYFCCTLRCSGFMPADKWDTLVEDVAQQLIGYHPKENPHHVKTDEVTPPPSRVMKDFLRTVFTAVSFLGTSSIASLGETGDLPIHDCVALLDGINGGGFARASLDRCDFLKPQDQNQLTRSITSMMYPLRLMYWGTFPFRSQHASLLSTKIGVNISQLLLVHPTLSCIECEDGGLWAEELEILTVDHYALVIHSFASAFLARALQFKVTSNVPSSILEALRNSRTFSLLAWSEPIEKWEELTLLSVLHLSPSRLQRSLGTMEYIRWLNLLTSQLEYLPRGSSNLLREEDRDDGEFPPWILHRLNVFRDLARSRIDSMYNDLQEFLLEEKRTVRRCPSPYHIDVSVLMAWCESECGGVTQREETYQHLSTTHLLPEYRVLSISMAALNASQANSKSQQLDVRITNVSSLLEWASTRRSVLQKQQKQKQNQKREEKNTLPQTPKDGAASLSGTIAMSSSQAEEVSRKEDDDEMDVEAELKAHWGWKAPLLEIPSWKKTIYPLESARTQLASLIAESLWKWLCEPEPSVAVVRVESMRPIDLCSIISLYSSGSMNVRRFQGGNDYSDDDDGGSRSAQTLKLVIETLTAQLPACSGEDLVAMVRALEGIAGRTDTNNKSNSQERTLAKSTRSLLARIPLLLATDTSAFERNHLFELFDRLHRLELVSRASVDAVLLHIKASSSSSSRSTQAEETTTTTAARRRVKSGEDDVLDPEGRNMAMMEQIDFQLGDEEGDDDYDEGDMWDVERRMRSQDEKGNSSKKGALQTSSSTSLKPRVVRRGRRHHHDHDSLQHEEQEEEEEKEVSTNNKKIERNDFNDAKVSAAEEVAVKANGVMGEVTPNCSPMIITKSQFYDLLLRIRSELSKGGGGSSVRDALQRLDALQRATGAHSTEYVQEREREAAQARDLEERISRLSKYKQTEYYATQTIAKLREALRELEEVDDRGRKTNERSALLGNGSTGNNSSSNSSSGGGGNRVMEHAIIKQNARRSMQQLQKYNRDAQMYARRENCMDACKELQHHINNVQRWYREQFSLVVAGEEDLYSGPGGNNRGEDGTFNSNYYATTTGTGVGIGIGVGGQGNSPVMGVIAPSLSSSGGNGGGGRYFGGGSGGGNRGNGLGATLLNHDDMDMNYGAQKPVATLHDDEEFQMFFVQVRQQDELMDQAMDRIAQGVSRIHDNALQLTSELQVQERLLDEVEVKVEKTTTELKGMNKRLKKVLKEVHQSDMCMYALCCISLLGVMGILTSFFK